MTSKEFVEKYRVAVKDNRGYDVNDPHELFWLLAYNAPTAAMQDMSRDFMSIPNIRSFWSSSVSIATNCINAQNWNDELDGKAQN